MTEQARADADGGWKDIIEDFTPEFFEFYFPDVHAAIDFSVAPRFLDAQLREIVTESEIAGREADRLIEVCLKDGNTEWLLVHVEVQGQPDPEFTERMFIYNYRTYDRYRRDVISLAVLADASPNFRPTEYRREMLGCRQIFTFLVAKLIDFDLAELEASTNPFALVTQIHREYLVVGADPKKRLDAKLSLTWRLGRRGYGRAQILRLYRFLDFVMRLPPEQALEYKRRLESMEGELKMPYITQGEQIARQEGLAEGLTEGQLQGRREDVIEVLEVRFREVPYLVREAIDHVESLSELKRLHRLAITVASLDDFKA